VAAPLVLGTIVFTGFEIPESMPLGGEQMLAIRKLPGGTRDIQAMGRDDADRHWSARLRGPNAQARAQELDTLRIAGTQQILSWGSYRYTVVIRSFTADCRQPTEIPYSISCAVISDLSNPIAEVPVDTDFAISSDLNGATGLSDQIISAQVTSALAAVSTAAGLVNTYKGASSAQLTGINTSITSALTAMQIESTARNGVVATSGSVGGVIAGQPPQALASTLLGQAESFQQLSVLYQAQSLLGRAKINIANAGS
jgi:hypothetical protein